MGEGGKGNVHTDAPTEYLRRETSHLSQNSVYRFCPGSFHAPPCAAGRVRSHIYMDGLLLIPHKHRLRTCLDGPPFVSGEPSRCIQCETPITYAHATWRELKHRMVLEIDVRPLGDVILDVGLSEWPEATACWRAACVNEGCKRLLYDRSETIRVIRDCIAQLPKTT